MKEDIFDYDFVASYIDGDDFIICADKGYEFALKNKITPNIIVGDFDSYENPYLDSLGKKGSIIDDYSEMEIISDNPVSVSDRYSFFSLLNITGCAKGITITGAKYPLVDGEITCEYQYGVSNEVLPGQTAVVSIKEGKLLLIMDR